MMDENIFTYELLERLIKIARKYRIAPIRFKAKDIVKIKSGALKGIITVKKNAKPDGRGKGRFYKLVFPSNLKKIMN